MSWLGLAVPVVVGAGLFYWLSRPSPYERELEESVGKLDREIAATLGKSRNSPRAHSTKSPRQIDAELAELAKMLKSGRPLAEVEAIAKKRRLGQP